MLQRNNLLQSTEFWTTVSSLTPNTGYADPRLYGEDVDIVMGVIRRLGNVGCLCISACVCGWASCWKKGGGEPPPPRASPWRLEHVKRYDCSIRVTWSRSGEPQTFPMMIGLICQTRISLRERAQPQRHETQTGRTPPIHHTHTHVHLQPQAYTDLITRLCVDVTECVEHKPKGLSLTAIFVDF